MNLEPVTITEKAIEEVRSIMDNKGIPADYALRIGIKGAGCGVMGFLIGFDKQESTDISYIKNDVSIIMDKKHVMYLMGVEIDFQEDAESRGFVFNKPEEQ